MPVTAEETALLELAATQPAEARKNLLREYIFQHSDRWEDPDLQDDYIASFSEEEIPVRRNMIAQLEAICARKRRMLEELSALINPPNPITEANIENIPEWREIEDLVVRFICTPNNHAMMDIHFLQRMREIINNDDLANDIMRRVHGNPVSPAQMFAAIDLASDNDRTVFTEWQAIQDHRAGTLISSETISFMLNREQAAFDVGHIMNYAYQNETRLIRILRMTEQQNGMVEVQAELLPHGSSIVDAIPSADRENTISFQTNSDFDMARRVVPGDLVLLHNRRRENLVRVTRVSNNGQDVVYFIGYIEDEDVRPDYRTRSNGAGLRGIERVRPLARGGAVNVNVPRENTITSTPIGQIRYNDNESCVEVYIGNTGNRAIDAIANRGWIRLHHPSGEVVKSVQMLQTHENGERGIKQEELEMSWNKKIGNVVLCKFIDDPDLDAGCNVYEPVIGQEMYFRVTQYTTTNSLGRPISYIDLVPVFKDHEKFGLMIVGVALSDVEFIRDVDAEEVEKQRKLRMMKRRLDMD